MEGDIIEKMDTSGLNEDILLNKNEWKRIIHVVDPAWLSFGSCNLHQMLGIKRLVVVEHCR